MHPGLISCPPTTPLRVVARMMATYRVHAVLVQDPLSESRAWRTISDTELIRVAALGEFAERQAGAVAVSPALTVASDDDLARAADTMLASGASHVVVVEPRSGKPIGVLSTLDVTRALAGFPERHPVIF
jgi:signal-transduction protein with cAMP-binding, CBS, and nucleotidyltransferase domain